MAYIFYIDGVPLPVAPSKMKLSMKNRLYNICKAQLGRGDKCWEIAKLNGIKNPNLIYPGQVIILG